MLLRSLALLGTLVGPLALPLGASAADGEVGGRSVRAASPSQPIALADRPIRVGLDRPVVFGASDVRPVPGVDIRIEGAREVLILPDGSLRVVLGRDRD